MDTWRLSFTVEPFVEGRPGPHVQAAVAAVQNGGLQVEMGPFDNIAVGSSSQVAAAIQRLVNDAIAAGATRLALQVGLNADAPAAHLHGAMDRLLESVAVELGAPLDGLSREDKQRAVRLLDERGAFRLRRAVDQVADALGVSRITVYNYLNLSR